jgi:hypothetical protein
MEGTQPSPVQPYPNLEESLMKLLLAEMIDGHWVRRGIVRATQAGRATPGLRYAGKLEAVALQAGGRQLAAEPQADWIDWEFGAHKFRVSRA